MASRGMAKGSWRIHQSGAMQDAGPAQPALTRFAGCKGTPCPDLTVSLVSLSSVFNLSHLSNVGDDDLSFGKLGDDLQPPSHCLDVGAKAGDVHVRPPLHLGDGRLVHFHRTGQVLLGDRARLGSCNGMSASNSAFMASTLRRRSKVESLGNSLN